MRFCSFTDTCTTIGRSRKASSIPAKPSGQAAVREVEEETGLRCRRGDRLPSVRYRDQSGHEKLVVYWLMEVRSGSFEPNDEVDVVGWFDFASAASMLSYDRDIELLVAMAPDNPPRRLPA